MRLELSHLIVWPAKHVIKENLPLCFKKLHPHVRCIIDCTEVLMKPRQALALRLSVGETINIISL
jgi:hypothetical protein